MSTDKFCKQFERRLGPTKCLGLIWIETETLLFPKDFFKKNDFNKSTDDKTHENYPACRVKSTTCKVNLGLFVGD